MANSKEGNGSILSSLSVMYQKIKWSRASSTWEAGGATGLTKVVDTILAKIEDSDAKIGADLGCGTGQLSIPMALKIKKVYAVDISQNMLKLLGENLKNNNIRNVETKLGAIEKVTFEPNSLDVLATNYALHHLRNTDKKLFTKKAYRWLKPGGVLIIGDMMFGRGLNSRDRDIIRQKVNAIKKRGLSGWIRISKNAIKFLLRLSEKPVPIEVWIGYLKEAGFSDITYDTVISEAVVMVAKK